MAEELRRQAEKENLPPRHPPICLRVLSGSETPVPMLAQAVTRIWTRCVIRTDCRDIILGASSIALGSVDLHGRSVFWELVPLAANDFIRHISPGHSNRVGNVNA